MDYEQARFNMVEQQIRTWDVLDQQILDLLFEVKREDFVPAAYRSLAFADLELPLSASVNDDAASAGRPSASGPCMWPPKIEARVLQALGLKRRESVLEIGTGSGYFAALLGRRAGTVTSVEIDPKLAAGAVARLARAGVSNVRCEVGDGARGWGSEQFDAIVLTGSTPLLPESFFAQLKPGGRVFAIVGEAPVMTARLISWAAPGSRVTTDLFETVIAPLVNAATPARFQF